MGSCCCCCSEEEAEEKEEEEEEQEASTWWLTVVLQGWDSPYVLPGTRHYLLAKQDEEVKVGGGGSVCVSVWGECQKSHHPRW